MNSSSHRPLQTREAVGAALGILGTFIAALFFAFFLPRLALYVTFLMPVLVGFLLSAVGSIGPRRFGFGNKKFLVALMVLGALIVWGGHHVFSYVRLVEFLASQTDVVGTGATDATAAALAWITESTGESGVWGYLAFVSQGTGTQLSPVGVLGKSGIGATGTLIVAVIELGLMIATASWAILFRTRALREGEGADALAAVDGEALKAALEHIDARRFAEAGEALGQPGGTPRHLVSLRDGDVTTEVSVFELDAFGNQGARTETRLMPREGGEALRRACLSARRGAR